MFDATIHAELIYDGGDTVSVPKAMGSPNENQLTGTVRENLCELALRVCYDSLGKERSRSSTAAHAHIIEVGHLSVYEHANFTVGFGTLTPADDLKLVMSLLNRPGVWVERDERSVHPWRVTTNLRTVLDWDRWTLANPSMTDPFVTAGIGDWLRLVANRLAPNVVQVKNDPRYPSALDQAAGRIPWLNATLADPVSAHEHWITLFLSGSRGMSHEQVRHGDSTAISQRSTRYVDEDGSPQVEHPLVSMYLREQNTKCCDPDPVVASNGGRAVLEWDARPGSTKFYSGEAYRLAASRLEDWLVGRNVDKFTARKQARGAARGFLPNALGTELVFSANVNQWHWMLSQRATIHADAEIRVLYSQVLRALKASQHAAFFDHLELVPSPDGIGEVAQVRTA